MSNIKKHKNSLPSLPRKAEKLLSQVKADSITNIRYSRGIKIFERYNQRYKLSDSPLYTLALLYDHLAMRLKAHTKNGDQNTYITYSNRAEKIYRELLSRDRHNVFALYGMHRIYGLRDNVKLAVRYAVRAYNLRNKLPKKQRGAMPVGHLFEQMGDIRRAEAWYKKEYRDIGPNDFGVNVNLLVFYSNQKRYIEALPFARKVEQLIETEFTKSQYRGLKTKIRAGKYLKRIRATIREVKARVGV